MVDRLLLSVFAAGVITMSYIVISAPCSFHFFFGRVC